MLFLKLGWSWLTSGGFTTLSNIYNRYKDSDDAKERQHAEWAKAQLDAMSQNRNQTSGFWEMRLLTFIIGGCFTLHLLAVTLDTIFALGWRIAKYPAPFDQYEGSILLSFFGLMAGVTTVSAVARTLTSIFGRK
jgi:hypothetical protein